MDIAEKVLRQKKDFDDVYEAGKKAEYDELWDGIQDYGNRTNYTGGFRNWRATTINPKYPINAISLYELFSDCRKLERLPVVTCADTSGRFTQVYSAFTMCLELKSIDFDVLNSGSGNNAWASAFRYCQKLKSIKKIGVMESQVFNRTFEYCFELENITIEGTIGQNGFDIHWSTLLSADSLKSIINALSPTFEGTITLPTTAESNYNASPPIGAPQTWAELVLTKPNWNITYLGV
jgi:hypothetical protein